MKALDTNILIRFLVEDDKKQADKAKKLLTNAEQKKEPLFVPILVVPEIIWVLQSAYEVNRQDIVEAIGNLLQMPALKFEHQNTLRDFIGSADKSNYDLSDILFSQSALTLGFETTLTFDKKASRFELFTMT